MIIATDGYVSVEAEAFDLIRNNLGNANMFAFGIGTSVNRRLIEGMARAGMGEPFVITKPEEAPTKAKAFRTLIESPVLTRIKMVFGGFEVYDVEPAGVPDVLADRPVIIFGKWRGKPQGTILIKGVSGEGEYQDSVNVSTVKPTQANSALRYLWARHRIAMLSDYNLLQSDDKRVKEITGLGLTYNLLTNYTSFVAVDSEVRNKNGKTTTVKQPLPLPEGVSDYAVGGLSRSAGAPAPMMMSKQKALAQESFGYAEPMLQDKAEPEKKAEAVFLKISEITVKGGLTKESIRKAADKQLLSLRSCLPTTQPSAKIKIKLTIDASGAVKAVEIVSTDIKDKAVQQCMQRMVKAWKFDANSAGKEAEAVVTLQVGT